MLLYWSETWKITRSEEKTLGVYHHKCLRRIVGIRWQHRVTNEQVRVAASTNDISDALRRRRLNWIGHKLHMDSIEDCVTALVWTPEGKRPTGRPTMAWRWTV